MKKTRNIGLLVLMATSLGQLNATQTTGGLPFETTATVFHPTDTPASVHGLQFRQLPQVWDEGIPLGNGIMGALIWQKDDRLRLALDRADLWDLRPVKEFSGSDYTFRFICEAVEKKDMSPVYRLIGFRKSKKYRIGRSHSCMYHHMGKWHDCPNLHQRHRQSWTFPIHPSSTKA